MAVRLLAMTPYDAGEAVSALLALDSSDFERESSVLDIVNIFNLPDYPFQPEWIAAQSSPFFSGVAATTDDTARIAALKTHPDCRTRAAAVAALLADMKLGGGGHEDTSAAFNRQRQLSDFELAENLYRSGNMAQCAYHALMLVQGQPAYHPYLVRKIGAALNACSAALADHRLETVVPTVSPFDKGDMRSLKALLNNVRLSEMRNITFYFLQKHYLGGQADDEFLFQYITAARRAGRHEAADAALARLTAQAPGSSFLSQLKNIQ